jgi:hypothetical protein
VQRYKPCRTYGVPLRRKSNEGCSKFGVKEYPASRAQRSHFPARQFGNQAAFASFRLI